MSKYRFNIIDRQAIHEAHERKCFYCGEIVYFSELQIDHIIPETLLDKEDDYKALVKRLSLPNSFNINSYYNWVPTHSKCNNRKSGELFQDSAIIFYLDLARRKVAKVLSLVKKINKRLESDTLLTTISFALAENIIEFSDIQDVIKEYDAQSEQFRLHSELEFIDRIYRNWINQNDFSELMVLPVKTGSTENEGLVLTHPYDSTIQFTVRSCHEYFEYTDKGYYPYSNYSIKMSAFFKRTCGLIQALKYATIPSLSYISEQNVSIKNYELLPLSLLESFAPDTSELIKSLPNATIKDWIEEGQIKIVKEFENGFQLEISGEGFMMIELLRADLNNDNIEDMLVFCYNYATEGTFGFGYTTKLSRKGVEKMFEKI